MSEDNGEREGGAGRSPKRGRGLAPNDPAWDLAPGSPFPAATPGSPLSAPRVPHSASVGSPGEPRCPDAHPQPADPGRRPVTQAPRGTWGGSSSCSEPGPPFPSPAAPPHTLASQARLCCCGVQGRRLAVGGQWGGRQQERRSEANSCGSSFSSRGRCPLFFAFVSHGYHGVHRGNWGM